MRVKLILSYDGTNYCGYQKQKNVNNTIQEILEDAIFSMSNKKTSVIASGRTDSGVHAKAQVCHFDTDSNISGERYIGLNAFLPKDISIISAEEVTEDFHARFSAHEKTYEYAIYVNEKTREPLLDRYFYHSTKKVDLEKMQTAILDLIGTHDFKAFNASGSGATSTVRTIYSAFIKSKENKIFISVTGNGFLYNMVRTIAGTLLEIGQGKLPASAIKDGIEKGDRKLLGKTLSPCGLTLISVKY